MKRQLARIAFRLFLGKKKRTIQVHGMRRSGNHACIDWIANALIESHVEWVKSNIRWISFSSHNDIVHLNDVGAVSFLFFICGIWAERKAIRSARFVIVSFEDCRPGVSFKEVAETKIVIERPAADILASRYHNINQRALRGEGWSSQSIRENFFSTLSALREFGRLKTNEGVTVWDFDKWRGSRTYRTAVLHSIHLKCDIMPRMSKVGGGSSFNLSTHDDSDRIYQVSPRKEWIEYLKWVESNHLESLEPSSRNRIQAFLQEQQNLTN